MSSCETASYFKCSLSQVSSQIDAARQMQASTDHDQYDDGVTRAAKRPRPTVADVAREAGVSPSTVSRALHTQGYASADVRRRVRAAAANLGYVVNSAARSPRSRTSSAVGVLISDLRNPFYADLATG